MSVGQYYNYFVGGNTHYTCGFANGNGMGAMSAVYDRDYGGGLVIPSFNGNIGSAVAMSDYWRLL